MSASRASFLKIATPSGSLRLSVTLRLLRWRFWKSKPWRLPPMPSPVRPPGISILMAWAPQSTSCRTHVGPARARVRSSTLKRDRGKELVVMLADPDGGLEDTREFLGDIVGAIRRYRPHTVFVHDPYRLRGFQHRDHRKAGITATDAVYPYARDHLHFPEQITRDGLEPHK